MHTPIDSHTLAAVILDGTTDAAHALNRPDIYDALNAGSNGRLPFLGTSTKIDAGLGVGVLTRVLYMMPAKASGGASACPFASAGCEAACLAEYTGKMSMDAPRRARRRRHASFMADRARFLTDVAGEIAAHAATAKRAGKRCAVRLNGTTDLLWERFPVEVDLPGRNARGILWRGATFPNLMTAFPDVTFYDYTKVPLRARIAHGPLPANYHLTYSLSERADAHEHAADYIAAGLSVAVVLRIKKGDAPATWTLPGTGSLPVIDGDKNDCRFTDTPGSIVALSAKGRAKVDTSGFVREPR